MTDPAKVPNTKEGRAMLAAEATRAKAEAAKFEAETAKTAAEARAAESLAVQQDIILAREQYKRAVELAADDYHQVYRFSSPVSDASAKSCMAKLATWDRLDPKCSMEIVFLSPGGDVVHGMALFDFIQQMRNAGHHVTTATIGYAASMAGILLQAGDTRVMSPESWLLIHEAQFGAMGSFGEVEDRVKWVEQVQDRILDIFAARSTLTKATIKRRWHRKDWWVSSDEALKLGFVDEIR